MKKHNVETAKYAMAKLSSYFRTQVQNEHLSSFEGRTHSIHGESVKLYACGNITIQDDHLNSFDLKESRTELEQAFLYYRQVRNLAAEIALDMLKEKLNSIINDI
jgi:hypothetical protein